MPDFSQRSSETEMIDSFVSIELLYQNLHELEFLNQYMGGHAVTIRGLKRLIKDKNRTYHIVDIGCGGGDTMRAIADWARRRNFNVSITGVDASKDAIQYVNDSCMAYPEIKGIHADYKELIHSGTKADIFHCSLFCHHLITDELRILFTFFRKNARCGFVVNDLLRIRLAYYGAKFLTAIGNGSVLSRNDGPASVLKGFRINEIKQLLNDTSIEHFEVSRVWLYRILITGYA